MLTPIVYPSANMKLLSIPQISRNHASRYEQVLQYFKNLKSVESGDDRPAYALTDLERMWLSRECILRYLRATKWKVDVAIQRIQSTLAWRRKFKVDMITFERISHEAETGKNLNFGFDKHGRPCIYLLPALQNTKNVMMQNELLVYTLERAVDLMPPGVESLILLIDFTKAGKSTTPSISQSREVLNILQNHYAERLGKAIVINVPWFVWTFFKLVQPWIDPVTRQKIKFNEDCTQYVPEEQLLTLFNGQVEMNYNKDVFLPALDRICRDSRQKQFERWKKLGGEIGLSEFVFRGGQEYYNHIHNFREWSSIPKPADLERVYSGHSIDTDTDSLPMLRIESASTENQNKSRPHLSSMHRKTTSNLLFRSNYSKSSKTNKSSRSRNFRTQSSEDTFETAFEKFRF